MEDLRTGPIADETTAVAPSRGDQAAGPRRRGRRRAASGGAVEPASDLLHHQVGISDYLQLAWLVGALATVGSALGAAVENDVVAQEAAYGYRPQDRSEDHQDDAPTRSA
jgi:hypothetical protein